MPSIAIQVGTAKSRKDAELDRLIRGMIEKGWCTHHVHSLATKHSPLVFGKLAELERSHPRMVDHTPCTTESRCIAFNTNMEHYIPAHTHSDCQCNFLSVNLNQLNNILEKGEVPIVRISYTNETADADLRLTLEPRTKTTKYTAISHVWVDGLGNPILNGIPRCQAEKLNLYLRLLRVGVGIMACEPMNLLCILLIHYLAPALV